MSPPQPVADPPTMTLADWAALEEDTPGELVDGRLDEDEMPSALHELVASLLLQLLGAWARPRGGVALGSELKLALSPRRGRKPDASVYFAGRPLPGRGQGATRRPPSLVVEVLSPEPRDVRRDRVAKLREYAAFGVEFYWIVDPIARTVEIHELGTDGVYRTVLAESAGTHATPGCAGLALDLDALWAEADRLPDDEDAP